MGPKTASACIGEGDVKRVQYEMFVLPMTFSEIRHQVVPIRGFRVDALSRGIRCIPDELLLGHELIQLRDVPPVEGIDETLDDLVDPLGRALIWSGGRSRSSSHLATGQEAEQQDTRYGSPRASYHRLNDAGSARSHAGEAYISRHVRSAIARGGHYSNNQLEAVEGGGGATSRRRAPKNRRATAAQEHVAADTFGYASALDNVYGCDR
jgi:hypothetical protein